MTSLLALTPTELRLLARDWTVLVFAFVFPPLVMLILVGIAVGLVAPSARSAQAIGLIAFFPLYLLGGGGPPKGAMTGAMHVISNALPSPIPGIVDPWLGIPGLGVQLAVFAGWSTA